MFRTLLTASTIACVMALGIPTGSAALTSEAQNPLSTIGKATKEVGEKAVKGAKKVGDVTTDAAKKSATETKNVGKTVKAAATENLTSARCKDGTVQTGKTKTDACHRHGGVRK